MSLQTVAAAVRRQARKQGSVAAREIRAALAHEGLSESLWREVVELAGPALAYRQGRYHYVPAGPERMQARVRREQRRRQQLGRAVRGLVRRRQAEEAVLVDRRAQPRIRFAHPAWIRTADGRTLHLLIRDISVLGLRLVGPWPLDGQDVRLWVPLPGGREPTCQFVVHVLWSAEVGDGLFESGGVFVGVERD